MVQFYDDSDIVRQVIFEGTFTAYGFTDSFGGNHSGIDAIGKIVIQGTGFPEIAGKECQCTFLEVSPRVYA